MQTYIKLREQYTISLTPGRKRVKFETSGVIDILQKGSTLLISTGNCKRNISRTMACSIVKQLFFKKLFSGDYITVFKL